MRFIDLFCGIGGFHIALSNMGGKCVFACDIDEECRKTYEQNFGIKLEGDIKKIDINSIPDHEVLCAGFPCQPFSICGKQEGFKDSRGDLIFYVLDIVKKKKPKVVLLENVKHLKYHNKGKTLSTIITEFQKIGFKISWKILNAKDYGTAQNRERIIIVASKDKEFSFCSLEQKSHLAIKNILDRNGNFEYLNDKEYTIINNPKKQPSGLIFIGYRNKDIRKKGVRHGTEHLSRVHKQPNRIYSSDGTHPTIPSQENSGRFFIYHEGKVRKLTINECFKLMGFPENFKKISSSGKLYNQIGNSVSIPMIETVFREIKRQYFK